jgi:DNA-binding LacI/PurR family transcriptional regulator
VDVGLSKADLRRISGVSIPTLSKIFADDPSVKDVTKSKVFRAIRRYEAQGSPPSSKAG